MVPDTAKPDSQEKKDQELSSLPSSDDQRTSQSWPELRTRTSMSDSKPKKREVSSTLNTPLNTVSSTTGTIWRKSGNTPSPMNSESALKNTTSCSLRPQ